MVLAGKLPRETPPSPNHGIFLQTSTEKPFHLAEMKIVDFPLLVLKGNLSLYGKYGVVVFLFSCLNIYIYIHIPGVLTNRMFFFPLAGLNQMEVT